MATAAICPGLRQLTDRELARWSPGGASEAPRGALEMVLPVADSRRYLPWLVARLLATTQRVIDGKRGRMGAQIVSWEMAARERV